MKTSSPSRAEPRVSCSEKWKKGVKKDVKKGVKKDVKKDVNS
jgi:hypothetical protein